jgi:serine protease AprX
MVRRFTPIIISILILLALALSPTHVKSQTALVGVRLPAGAQATWQHGVELDGIVIDYGSFTWTILSPAELADLESTAVPYQAYPSPYTLTLGGQTFDPLLTAPPFSPDQLNTSNLTQPGLHLVQFHGPTKSAWLDALQANGLDIVQYIHPFTYMVWGESPTLASQANRDFVRWIGDYLPAYALQPQGRSLDGETSHVRILVYPKAGLAQTIQAVQALGGSVLGASSGLDPTFDLLTCLLPADQVQSAAALPGVYTIQPVPTDGGNRGEMSNQVNANNINSSNQTFPGYQSWLSRIGLSGQGVIIANVDSGLDQNHPDLTNRVLPCNGTTCGFETASDHGTHTAGIMAGDGKSGMLDSFGFLRGLGMAPSANLVEQLYEPTYTFEGGMLTLMMESYRNGAVISGNSWGPSRLPLGYDADTRWVDIGVRDADPDTPGDQSLSYVLSIMNGYGGTSSQGTPDEAKNALTVGSTIMQFGDGRQNPDINNLSSNTAHGPALDGRNLPHLVAPGCYVDSTYYPASGYQLRCGTSFASPHVSGAVALFIESYRYQFGVDPSPALVKAAFLAVAHDLAGYLDADGILMTHPFDSKQGWGRLDAEAVLNFPGEVRYFDQEVAFDDTGQTWTHDIILTTPAPSLKVMLVWTDAPGHGLGGATPAWVNDLDLSIEIGGQTYYGNNFGPDGFTVPGGTRDDMNNTEGIFLDALAEGIYTLKVTAVNISGDGVPSLAGVTDQDFALVIYIPDSPREETRYEYIFPIFFR